MKRTITGVRIVTGKSLVSYWRNPMVIITTNTGEYINEAHTVSDWGPLIGKTVETKLQHSNAKGYDWLHLVKE